MNSKSHKQLREAAEKLLLKKPRVSKNGKGRTRDLSELMHELQVYQVELEMQNDELKVSQQTLEEERGRFANLFNLAPVAYSVLNEGAMIKQYNAVCQKLFDPAGANLRERRFQSFVAPDYHDVFYIFIRKITQSEATQSAVIKMISAGNSPFYAQIHGKMHRSSPESAASYYLTFIDASEKIEFENKQKEATERLQMALNASHSGTIKVSVKTGEMVMDDNALRIFDIKKKEFKGKFSELYEKVHPEDKTLFDNSFRAAMVMNKPFEIEFRIVKKDEGITYVQSHGHVANIANNQDFFIGLFSDITARKMAEGEMQKEKDKQQKETLKAIISAQEQERYRISDSLHDSLGQLLYATSLKLQHSKSISDKSYTEALALLEQAIKETRNLSFVLAPSVLADFGIPAAVPEMIKRLTTPLLNISCEVTGFEKRLSLGVEKFIFRILQELLNNVIKHSKATFCSVKVVRRRNKVTLRIQDNGIGLKVDKNQTHGSGLYSIRNRIGLYNGEFNVSTPRGKGTIIVIHLFDVNEKTLDEF